MTTTAPLCLRRPALAPLCLRAYVAKPILRQVLDQVPVRVVLADGTVLSDSEAAGPTLEIVRPTALYERIAHNPKVGIGEAYMAGDWRAAAGTDLAAALAPFATRLTSAVPPSLRRFKGIVDRRIPRRQRNTILGSRRNIEAHYDLSNDLFAGFLDETMTYSSALFASTSAWESQSLAGAQRRKIDTILDRVGVTDGGTLLEIGTGWGALALAAAERGARVTTVTLSAEQAAFAKQRIAAAGLSHLVDIRLEDYREVTGRYDAVVSVEMIEAVGEQYWPTYFRTIDARLAPGGRVVVQSIVMAHDRMLATRNSFGWIQKHIFPGGLIPSVEAIEEVTAVETSLRVVGVDRFGAHYAETLRRWRMEFLANWPRIRGHGFDEEFRRKWEFYLAYCEAGFATGYLDVAHVRLERPAG